MSRRKKHFQRHEKKGKSRRDAPRPAKHRPPNPRSEVPREEAPLPGRLLGTVDKHHRGFAHLIIDGKEYEDVFIPPRQAGKLFHGDRVEIQISKNGEIEDLNVLAHRFKKMVGRYAPAHPRGGWVTYERKSSKESIFIPERHPDAKKEDWVLIELSYHKSGPHSVTGIIKTVLGDTIPASMDVEMIAGEFNIEEEHTDACKSEAAAFRLDIPGKDTEGRTDLTHVPFITIDGETARDFDDAIFVEKTKIGYALWVAIADVSHYVRPGTILDREAHARGTSVYFPERAFHMLPRELSENLCSLRPNEYRLAMVSKISFDLKGKKTGIEIFEAYFKSRRRATYNEIQKEWEQNKTNPSWEYAAHFELYSLLRKQRSGRGSIDFELPEAEILVDDSGEPTSIRIRKRQDTHRLIEEFMISANESVTEWIMKRGLPFIYRTHAEPNKQAMARFKKVAESVGFRFTIPEHNLVPLDVAEIVQKTIGHAAETLLNTSLLRSMSKAIYSAEHGGHFGLASEAYTHFTSPIRRYPDLLVHRMLKLALLSERDPQQKLSKSHHQSLDAELQKAAEHCSYRERLASDAEREAIRLKQVRIALQHIGEEYEGSITGMLERGIFIQVDDPYIEGLLAKEELGDDFFQFNEDKMIFYARRSRQTYRIGDRVQIQILNASVERRQVDLALAGTKPKERASQNRTERPRQKRPR